MKKKINQIAGIKAGFLFKEGISADKEGNVSVIQLKDLDEQGILDLSKLQRITLANIDSKNFLAMGDVLLKAKTNHPVAGVIREQLPSTIATAHYFIISVKNENILPGYLAWYLNQHPAQVFFNRNSGGTRIQVINKQTLGDLEVLIPDMETQKKIVKVFRLHQREQELIENIKEEKHKLISAQLLSTIAEQ